MRVKKYIHFTLSMIVIYFFLMIRRPPRSTLFPTRRSSDLLTRAMRKAGLPLQRLLGGDALATLAKDLRYADVTALYAAVGENQISASSIVEKLIAALGGTEGAVEDIAETTIPMRRPVHRRTSGGEIGRASCRERV